jgi:hypothetical protein
MLEGDDESGLVNDRESDVAGEDPVRVVISLLLLIKEVHH